MINIYDNLSHLSVLDCTIRDGGYLNDWTFDHQMVREFYRAVSKAGVDWFEIGYRDKAHKEKYNWRYVTEELLTLILDGVNGAKIAVMVDNGKVDISDFVESSCSKIDMIRIATNYTDLQQACVLSERFKDKGYQVSINLMGITNLNRDDKKKAVFQLQHSQTDYVYVVDSYGSLFPYEIKETLSPFMEMQDKKIGFHPHNSLQLAFANALEAIDCGISIIDSTILGIGRGAGNLPTEALLSYIQRFHNSKYNALPVLNVCDRMQSISSAWDWGYQLPYLLSGIFKCHPSYAKKLIGYKEFTVEDMWKAMEIVDKKRLYGFSEELLDEIIRSGLLGNAHILNEALNKEHNGVNASINTSQPDSTQIEYLNRHKGREFLILANGPSLKKQKEDIKRFIDKYDPIILGANYLGELFVPHYHAFSNKKRFAQYVGGVSTESELLIGQYIPQSLVREYTERSFETMYYMDCYGPSFDIIDGIIQTNCRTISVLLLGIAVVMGADRIFAAGMDGYVGTDSQGSLYFYNDVDTITDRTITMELHKWCDFYISQIDNYLVNNGKEGVHIITPTGYANYYKGIDNYL